MSNHPADPTRVAPMTRIPRDLIADVTAPTRGTLHGPTAIDTWFRLKERQTLADGSSARINWDRRDILAGLASHMPDGATVPPAPHPGQSGPHRATITPTGDWRQDWAQALAIHQRAAGTIARACRTRMMIDGVTP